MSDDGKTELACKCNPTPETITLGEIYIGVLSLSGVHKVFHEKCFPRVETLIGRTYLPRIEGARIQKVTTHD